MLTLWPSRRPPRTTSQLPLACSGSEDYSVSSQGFSATFSVFRPLELLDEMLLGLEPAFSPNRSEMEFQRASERCNFYVNFSLYLLTRATSAATELAIQFVFGTTGASVVTVSIHIRSGRIEESILSFSVRHAQSGHEAHHLCAVSAARRHGHGGSYLRDRGDVFHVLPHRSVFAFTNFSNDTFFLGRVHRFFVSKYVSMSVAVKLYVPREETFSIPMKYIDVTRTT